MTEKLRMRGLRLLVLSLAVFLVFGCGDGGDYNPSLGPVGQFTINTSGADGGPDGGSGGDGGDVDVYMYYGSMGPLEILESGAADASFTRTVSTPNLGDNPLAITSDTTITVEAAEPAEDTPYLVAGDSNLYISDGNAAIADEAPVTGISVAEGTTLTLELNFATYAGVSLYNDIDNDGTITTVDFDATQRGDLELYFASYHGNSTIDTSGTQDGQSGGYVYLYPNYSFFNDGTINTSGAGSTTGAAGDGGDLYVYADYVVENTGDITTDGGAASGAAGTTGGNAGCLDLEADYNVHNSGNLSSRGGDGVTAGGDGYEVYLYVGYAGGLLNSGDLDTSGGDATGGPGGDAGYIDIYSYGGGLINSGNLTAKGGDTTDPSSDGGDGDDIYLYVDYEYIYEYTPAGDVLFSGNVDISGGLAVTDAGATGSGGSGGDFEIEADYDYYPLGQRVALLGYGSIDASGGDGNYGGHGGDVYLACDYGETDTGVYTPSCNLTNEVDINTSGGSVVAGATTTPADGGDGGDVDLETDSYYGMFDQNLDHVVNSGDINTSGGDSLESTTQAQGWAGDFWLWGYNGVTNSGNLAAIGGNDPGTDGGTTGYGNSGGYIGLYAELGPVDNSGDLTSDAGDGEYEGGDAYEIELFGPEVSNSGALAANGGDANPLLAGSTGGDGGCVELFCPGGMQCTTQTGTAANAGGAGETPGTDGDYVLGGELQ